MQMAQLQNTSLDWGSQSTRQGLYMKMSAYNATPSSLTSEV